MSCSKGDSGEGISICHLVYMSLLYCYVTLKGGQRWTHLYMSSCLYVTVILLCDVERGTAVDASLYVILFICHCIGCYVMQKGKQW